MKKHASIAQEILQICKLLHSWHYLAAADGNVSFRCSDKEILITPAACNKAYISKKQIALLNLKGKILKGEPSTERALHLAIYRAFPKARAIIHAHPPIAVAFSIAYPQAKELPLSSMPEVILGVGSIPIAPYQRPGTEALAHSLLDAMQASRVAILARHGVVAWGESLVEALNGIERIEHAAQILQNVRSFGEAWSTLDQNEINWLLRQREQGPEKNL